LQKSWIRGLSKNEFLIEIKISTFPATTGLCIFSGLYFFWILWNTYCGVVFKNKVFDNWNDNWKRLSVIIKFTYTGIYLFFVFFHVIILFWLLVHAYKVSNWLRYGKNMVRMWHIVPSKIVIISLISVKEPIIDSSSHIHAQVEPFCVSNAKAVIVHRSRRTMS